VTTEPVQGYSDMIILVGIHAQDDVRLNTLVLAAIFMPLLLEIDEQLLALTREPE